VVEGLPCRRDYTSAPVSPGQMEVMMSRMKVMLLSLLAVFAIGAIASASASALIWAQCSPETGGRFSSQTNCESLTTGGGTGWEFLPLLATAANPLLVPTKGKGNQKLSVSSGAFVIECTNLKDSDDRWNEGSPLNGKDLLLEGVYTGCTVTKPGPNTCLVVHSPGAPNGTISLAEKIPSRLVTIGGVIYEEEEQNANKEFVTIEAEETVGSGKPCGVAKLVNKVKGSVIGEIPFMSLVTKFAGKSGSKPLEMNTLPAEYNGEDESGAEAGMVNVYAK
jgi:hypothetical protein